MKLTPEKIQTLREETEALMRKVREQPDYPAAAAEFDREYEIARAINKARNRAPLSQVEIAAKMGTTQPAVSRMERGRLTFDTLCKYVEACGGTLKLSVV